MKGSSLDVNFNEFVECPRCRRLDFTFEAHRSCPDCHWVIRPEPVDHVYGCDVLVEIRVTGGRSEIQEKHYKGSPANCRTGAMNRANAMRVLAIVPLSREQYLRAYGDPSRKAEH